MTNMSTMVQVAEKSDTAGLVSMLFGSIIGACSTVLVNDIIENVAPKPVDLTEKIVYGIGSYAIGGLVGGAVADKMTEEMKKRAGGLLILKATWNEMIKVSEVNTETEN